MAREPPSPRRAREDWRPEEYRLGLLEGEFRLDPCAASVAQLDQETGCAETRDNRIARWERGLAGPVPQRELGNDGPMCDNLVSQPAILGWIDAIGPGADDGDGVPAH